MTFRESLPLLANFIDGEFSAPASGRYIDNFSPATGLVYAQIPNSDASDVDAAVEAAKRAFPAWRALSPLARAEMLHTIADKLEARTEEFARAESIDQGKTLRLARDIEIPRAVKNFRFFADFISGREASRPIATDIAMNEVVHSPLGVAALISPWNLPLYLLTWKIAPAIAFGNTVVCKPSELTPMTAFMLGEVLTASGLPPGVCNIVHGLGSKAGEALVTHPDVKLVSFTGGTKTGKHIAELCARDLKRASLELGGKNPGIIFADADLGECIPTTLRSSFQNQGEICLCNSRLYVEDSLFPEFVERFSAVARRAKPGDPLSDNSFLGPLVSREHREKVMGYLEIARAEGATFHLGGGIPELPEPFSGGYFLEPTILSNVAADSRVQMEEIFGPVVTITPFHGEDEALHPANSTEFGLPARTRTQDEARAARVARAIDSATVWVNTWMLRDLNAPFGGMKKSGWGREGAEWSLDFYTETKNICSKPGASK